MAEIVWNFAELANACMAVPNLICVLRLWKTVKEGAVRFESSIKKSEQRKTEAGEEHEKTYSGRFHGELVKRAKRIAHFFPLCQQLIENLRVGG